MSTYKSRKEAAKKNGLSYARLLSTSALTAASLVALAGPAHADNSWGNLSTDFGGFDTDISDPNVTNITLRTDRAGGTGNLDIAQQDTVNIFGKLFVARDDRLDPTFIRGKLNSTGELIVIDQNGIFFTDTSVVNVSGIVATTGNISNEQILNNDFGDYVIDGATDGRIELSGTVNVAQAGLAAFVSPTILNSGIINAKLGKVAFAAGEEVTLDLYGDGLVEIAVDGELADALIENTGEIRAEGGTVQMTARAAKGAVDNIINVDGLITVASAEVQGGKIILSGGDKGNVNVGGTLDASGTDGGSIDVNGENITVAETAELYADGGKGADQTGNGGRIDVIANRHLDYRGSLFARGGALGGNGGNAETSGYEFLGYSGLANLSAPNGDMGTLLLDPSFAVVHSGLVHEPLGQGYVLASWALANSIENASITVQADNFIDVGTRIGGYNTGNGIVDGILNALIGTDPVNLRDTWNTFSIFGATFPTSVSGTTNGSITFESDVVNFNQDVIMGGGNIGVDAATVNLDSKLYAADETTLLGNGRLIGSNQLTTINVKSDSASINQALGFADSNQRETINVEAGTYAENVIVNKAVDLLGAHAGTAGTDGSRGVDESVVEGGSPAFTVTTDNVLIDGFTMDGLGLTYGVKLNDVKNITISNNVISNSSIAGIGGVIDHDPGVGTLVIDSNLIDGSNTGDGIALAGDSAGKDGTQSLVGVDIDITNNQIGEDGDAIGGKGVTFTKVGDLGDSIELAGTTNVTAEIEISGNDVYSTDNAVEFSGSVADATIDISNNNDGFVTGENGVVFDGVVSDSDIDIDANIFDVDKVGIAFNGEIKDGSTVDITDNAIGTDVDPVLNGILFDKIGPATINVSGGAIYSGGGAGSIDGDGINFRKGTHSGADVTIEGITITSDGDEAIDFHQAVRSGSTVDIASGAYRGGNNGIEFAGIAGDVSIGTEGGSLTWVDGRGADKRGINLLGSITGSLDVVDTFVHGTDDAIGSNDDQNNVIDGGTVTLRKTQPGGAGFVGDSGDAVEFASVINGGTLSITGIDTADQLLFGGDNGLHIVNGVNNSSVSLNNVGIYALNHGILFGGASPSVTNNASITVENTNIFSENHGIFFEEIVNGGAEVNIINGNKIETADVDFSTIYDLNGDVLAVIASDLGASPNTADGIHFANGIDDATVNISESSIEATGNGVFFGGGSPSISGGAVVKITYNDITAEQDGVFVEDDITGPGTKLQVSANTIDAGDDGLDIDNVRNGARVDIGGVLAYDSLNPSDNKGNTIIAENDGVKFDAGIDAIVSIRNNRVDAGDDGVDIADDDAGHTTSVDSNAYLEILNNDFGSVGSDTIGDDGIVIDETITGGSTVVISGNNIGRSDAAVGDDGVDLDNITGGASVSITNNPNIYATDNGVNVTGSINGGANFTVSGNNHGIHTGDHGLFIGGAVSGGATVNIHDNIIQANLNQDAVGSGIFFDGTVSDATVSIGNGTGNEKNDGGSNVISVRDNNGAGGAGDLDGIHFDKEIGTDARIKIDGNRIGYFAFNVDSTVYNSAGGYNRRIADDGIEFKGQITGNADIDIEDNFIRAKDDGVQFSGSVSGSANIQIGGAGDRNTIDAWDDGISFLNTITGQSLVEISYNDIDADDDGVLFGGMIDNAKTTGGTSGNEILIKDNDIYGENNGVHFEGEIDGTNHDTLITGNTIKGEDGQGIVFDDKIDEAHVKIVENTRIEGEIDGIRFLGRVEDGARVNIDDNTSIEGRDDEAIHFFETIEDSTVSIFSNDDLEGGDHGVEFDGSIDNSTIVISENNHGIHANNHGIVFFGNIFGGSDIDIHDNIISANEDGGSTGDGVHFGGDIYTATINIGDGNGASFGSNPSNYIRGVDGIHFAGTLNSGTEVEIDGNRIGYGKTSGGTTYSDEMEDDGIQFADDVQGSATVKITDNWINADDDGISFLGDIEDDANVLIGGSSDGNTIDADDDGIQFEDEIREHALLEISHNTVDADDNGIEFNGDTSNHIHSGHSEEILIAHNDIEGGENGILFEGRASHELHDIVIRDNDRIVGESEDGIAHTGGIDDAELAILDNDEIYGDRDGIHIEGNFFNNAKILIDGNTDIEADDGDGIEITDIGGTGGADVDVTDNHVHHTGDNGIEIANVDGVNVEDNEVHDTDGHGIYVSNSDYADIIDNEIYDIGEHGIFVNPSDYVDIADNVISDVDWDGIHVDDGIFADIWDNEISETGDDGIHVDSNFGVDIWSNDISETGEDTSHGDGIFVQDSNYADVNFNNITIAGRDGINIWSSDNVDVIGNDIFGEDAGFLSAGADGAGRDGIHIEYSDDADIFGNEITGGDAGFLAIGGAGAGRDGIYVANSDNADIIGNEISGGDFGVLAVGGNGADRDGIHVVNSFNADILFNDIFGGTGFALGVGGVGAGDDGIYVNNSTFADVRWNDVSQVGGDGIDVRNSFRVDIVGNDVSETGDDGIYVDDSEYADVNWNDIRNAGSDGIDVEDSDYADIIGNSVGLVADNGIEVEDSFAVDLRFNNVFLTGEDGIHVHDSHAADIQYNLVALTGDDGIHVHDSSLVEIENNFVALAGGDGIDLENSLFSSINDNITLFVADNGIEVEDSAFITITDNITAFSGDAGIFVDPSAFILVDGNTATNNNTGIHFDDVTFGTISNNTVENNLTVGIQVEDSDAIDILNNDITNNGDIGFFAKGGSNGDIALTGNVFTDNPIQAQFESGLIDLTGIDGVTGFGNEFFGGNVGLYFSPFGGDASLLSLVDGDALGFQTFEGTGGVQPTNYGGTIGDQFFDGQGTFYVQLDNNAFTTPGGEHIWLNGLDSTYVLPAALGGPLRPADNAGILTADQFEYLELRFDHLPDTGTTGIFFFGFVPSGDVDQSRVFNQFDGFAGAIAGLNVTITGLPSVGPLTGPGAGVGTPGPFALAGIAPAAGGEEGAEYFASLEPAAGEDGTPINPQDIEPAAGGSTVGCWGDAVSAAGAGGVASLNWGGSFEDSIVAASSCGSETF